MRHPEMSRPFLVIALLLPLIALAAGCYTVLEHPAGPEVVDDSGQRDCYDCHQDAAAHHFDPFYSGAFQYYPDRWYPYYGRPWWWQNYWYFPPVDDPEGVPAEMGRRHLWNRGDTDLLPPAGPQIPGFPGGVSTPGAPAPPDPGNVRTETKKTGEDKGKTEKKAKDKKDEDKKRHLWDR